MKMLILPWTVGEVKDMVALGELGVDGIITKYPVAWWLGMKTRGCRLDDVLYVL